MYLFSNLKYKALLTGFLFLVVLFGTTYAQSSGIDNCGDMEFTLIGNTIVKPQQKTTFSIASSSILDQQSSLEYELWQDGSLLYNNKEQEFIYTFTKPGSYTLKSILRRTNACVKSVEQSITVSDHVWIGIGLPEEERSFLSHSLQSQSIGFIHIPGFDTPTESEKFISRIQNIARTLPSSDVLLVTEKYAPLLFDHLKDMRTYGIGFPERIILVGKSNKSTTRRLLYQAPDILLFSQIAVTPSVYLSSVAQQLINNKSLESLDVVQLIDLETKNEKWLSPLGFSVDYLLGHGMSINFLIFLLIIPLVTLFVVIGKQVIGLSPGSLYYILLTSGVYMFVGPELTITMFFSTLLGHILTLSITKKIYLLHAPKIGMSIVFSCILFLLISSLSVAGNIFIHLPTDPLYVFFPLVMFSSIMPYFYPYLHLVIQKEWWLGFLQFIGMSIICILLFQWSRLQQLVLGYPDILLLVGIAMLYLGRYAGLQFSEYIRFWPLVTKYFNDDEE